MLPVDVFRPSLTKLVEVLRRVGIRFHLTGGITAVAYGEPRMTQDLDLVIDASAAARHRDELLAALRQVNASQCRSMYLMLPPRAEFGSTSRSSMPGWCATSPSTATA